MGQVFPSRLRRWKTAPGQPIYCLEFRRPRVDAGLNIPIKRADACRLLSESQPLFAFPQIGFCTLALRNVDVDARDADRPAGFVLENCAPSEQPVYAAIGPNDTKFLVPNVCPRERNLIVRPHLLAVFRVNQPKPFVVREHRLPSRQTINLAVFAGTRDYVCSQIAIPYGDVRCTLGERKLPLLIAESPIRLRYEPRQAI